MLKATWNPYDKQIQANHNQQTTIVFLFSPLWASFFSDVKIEEIIGSWTFTGCVGPSGVVGETDDGVVKGSPQTLSVSLVPCISSTSPLAWQLVWFLHLTALNTSENVPLVHGLQTVSCVSVPCFFTLEPWGQREWGLHLVAPSRGRKLLARQVQTRSLVAVQGTFSTKPTGQGARQRWHCWTPFSPRVKVPSGQGLHSLTAVREQWTDT